MGARFAGFALAFGSALIWPSVCLAGMPTPVLSDWGVLGLSAISFFAAVVLAAAAVIRLLWNSLAADFPRLPRLTYRKTLAAVVLWGLALVVVLTMIAGARELLTPGAWQRDGALYKLSSPEAPPLNLTRIAERRESLRRLHVALSLYAAKHGGQFPPSIGELGTTAAVWEVPGGAEMQYIYLPGRRSNDPDDVLACEPAVYGDQRLVLYTGGQIVTLSSREIRGKLHGEERP